LVEFHGETPYPVEYKHGPVRRGQHADLQLCAQAMCLEEMLGVPVPRGAVYHFSSRTRREVSFTLELRQRVCEAISAIRVILLTDTLPPAPADARCKNCSLVESCLPFVVANWARLPTLQRRLFTPIEVKEALDGQ
jgi:CRISPR-associated exonuclease Cas4